MMPARSRTGVGTSRVDAGPGVAGPRTVRTATFDVLRRLGLTTVFANPGSTEIPLLTDLPDDLRFVLGLHEGSVVGMATGFAIARAQPSLVVLHTTAGLGNAVGALATSRVNRAPLVVLVGQQDRRHLVLEPFLAGRLDGLAGDYPVGFEQPVRAQDVPGALARAWHQASTGRGAALVVVPMDDWEAPAGEAWEIAAPAEVVRPSGPDPDAVSRVAGMISDARSPALVVGAGADDAGTWAALVELAERLRCPVWQEAFGARAGFPQDHSLFAGHLPPVRAGLRRALSGHDLVLAVGAPVFRQYHFEHGPLVAAGTSVVLVSDDSAEIHRSPADVAVLTAPAAFCAELAGRLERRDVPPPDPMRRPPPPTPPAPSEPLLAGHLLAALAERLPGDAVLLEEAPSSRPELHARIPARQPLGFVSAAMGGLGFGLPGAVGLRMALPDRPVVAVVGDGSALYGIQALWSAGHYRVGVLFVVVANGGYRVMDRLAERHGGVGPWPPFAVDMTAIAAGLGCPARRIVGYDDLLDALDEALPELAVREEPLLLEVVVAPDPAVVG
jgi:benzoylformate decarboxylase